MDEDYKEKIEQLTRKYEEEQNRCTKLRTELREAHNLLCLVDLSSNLRLQVWQSRAKDAEKKLNETSDILSVDNENSKKAVSRLHDNDEILSQPSTTLSVYGEKMEKWTEETVKLQ